MIKNLFISLLSCLFLAGCDIIPEEDRLLPMDEIIPLKNVLLVEFTDQDCINCPYASIIIDMLKSKYGNKLMTVSVHASSRSRPLVTPEGTIYETHFRTNEIGHPAGLIDGTDLSVVYEQWESFIIKRFNQESPLNLDLSVHYNPANREIYANSKVIGEVMNLRLLLWVIEDGVIHWQKMPDNTTDPAFEHNHLLRAAMNTVWGEEIGNKKEIENSFILDETWVKENISVVGFIYNASTYEVFDVKQIYLH